MKIDADERERLESVEQGPRGDPRALADVSKRRKWFRILKSTTAIIAADSREVGRAFMES
jgi:hypothetical protein